MAVKPYLDTLVTLDGSSADTPIMNCSAGSRKVILAALLHNTSTDSPTITFYDSSNGNSAGATEIAKTTLGSGETRSSKIAGLTLAASRFLVAVCNSAVDDTVTLKLTYTLYDGDS
jgi:hypothetical protein